MLRVNDLKQYEYCPRVVYYQYVMPAERNATFKMEHGKSAEARIDELEQRRTVRRYRLPDGTRHFHVRLTSEALGLTGKLDLLIESSAGWYPVDFKETTVPQGFLYLIPGNHVEAVALTETLKTDAKATLQHIRDMIMAQRVPEPTAVRAHCTDCEYHNYCGDVL